jgi:NADH:ubiquinone oxidoreductase subunit 6 (subunit J)
LFNVSGLPCPVLIDQGVFKGYAWAFVGANKRIVYVKNLVYVHLFLAWFKFWGGVTYILKSGGY